MRDSIISKVIAGVLTTASIATSVGAGYKVFAEHNSAPAPVPTIAESSPLPTSSPEVLGTEIKASEKTEATATPTPSASASPTPSASPSVSPLPSFSPMPSFTPGKFDDSSDDSVEIEDQHVHVGVNASTTTSVSPTPEAGDN